MALPLSMFITLPGRIQKTGRGVGGFGGGEGGVWKRGGRVTVSVLCRVCAAPSSRRRGALPSAA